jgi:hypothetical protein
MTAVRAAEDRRLFRDLEITAAINRACGLTLAGCAGGMPIALSEDGIA